MQLHMVVSSMNATSAQLVDKSAVPGDSFFQKAVFQELHRAKFIILKITIKRVWNSTYQTVQKFRGGLSSTVHEDDSTVVGVRLRKIIPFKSF